MAIRWILTVLAIICFSVITDRVVKKKDLPLHDYEELGIILQKDFCMGCSICTKEYPELFVMQGKKAAVNTGLQDIDMKKLAKIREACPVKAIQYNG
jgi:ferredoxin